MSAKVYHDIKGDKAHCGHLIAGVVSNVDFSLNLLAGYYKPGVVIGRATDGLFVIDYW